MTVSRTLQNTDNHIWWDFIIYILYKTTLISSTSHLIRFYGTDGSRVNCVHGASAEWYRQWETELLGDKYFPLSICPPQIPHWRPWDRTRSSPLTGRRLTHLTYRTMENIGDRWWWHSGWGTVLQIGRSLVRFQMVSLNFSVHIILLIALWHWGRLSL
jgi:hypothetical protein